MAIPLNYARPSPRRFGKVAVVLILIATVVGVCIKMSVRTRIALIISRWSAVHFTMPPDKVVWTNEKAEVRKLAGVPGYSQVDDGLINSVQVPPPYGARAQGGVLFVHRLYRPDGTPRLVEVFAGWPTSILNPVPFWYCVIDLQATSPSMRVTDAARNFARGMLIEKMYQGDGNIGTLYAGQLDPNDRSSFAARYRCNGVTRMLRCRLTNNDQLVFSDEDAK